MTDISMQDQIRDMWPLMQKAMLSVGEKYWPDMSRAVQQVGVQGQWWHLISALQKGQLSLTQATQCDPYSSEKVYRFSWAELKKHGWLTKEPSLDRDIIYHLSEKGQYAAQTINAVADQKISSLTPLPPTQLNQLHHYLRALADACQNMPQPEQKPLLTDRLYSSPEPNATTMLHIQQALGELDGFHEDCHLAAWQIHDIDGFAWEAFTYIQAGKANTTQALAQALPHRGYSANEYAVAVRQIEEKGWVTADALSRYTLTPQGKQVYDTAEKRTNELFSAPFAIFTAQELMELKDILNLFYDNLNRDTP